ncbi:MAG: beta-lactamase family protein [Roseivirga sp.]|nr:beta-lactamase family protein [Roseivirga sp.]
MRTAYCFALLIISHLTWAQTVESRILQVEQGLTMPGITPFGQETKTGNTLDRLKAYRVHGASVAVIHQGKLDWSKAYGITDAANPEKVTTETLFQCASIGKVITALAALKLVEKGKISLDESVNNKLKRWQIPENEYTKSQPVTLRHLLSHSAGFTDEYGFLGYIPDEAPPSLLQILKDEPPSNAKKPLVVSRLPGTMEQYSGGGYLIVQLLIEDLSELSFTEFVQQQLFNPLGLSHTTYDFQPDRYQVSPVARGHRSNGKVYKKKKYHLYPEHAAAGPWTTAEDLAKLVIAIQKALNQSDNSLLAEDLILEFISPQMNLRGLGANLRGIEKTQAYWHSGQNLGYTGLLYGLTSSGDGAVILLNSEGGEMLLQEFISSVASVYNWPVMNSYQAMEILQSEMRQLTGTYESADRSKKLAIEEEKGALVVKTINTKQGAELFKIAENHYTFQNAQDYFKLSFQYKDTKVISLLYEESIGKLVELKKLE